MRSIIWLGSVGLTVLLLPFVALAGEAPTASAAKAVVAAGFGFQDEDSSFITVKTYDAHSGEVLSAERFGITAISCSGRTVSDDMKWNPCGVTFDDGTTRPSYDWIVPSR